jgi:DNA-binding response OmpR family regulator
MANKKIVLMEDEEILANMYKIKFSNAGYNIEVAGNGEVGLKLVKRIKPDIILLDIIMPEMDGFAVLAKLKSDTTLKKIPVFMLTNLGQEEDMKKGKDMGAVGYYVKADVTPGELVKTVNKFFKE